MKKYFDKRLILTVLCVAVGMAPLLAFVNTLESAKHMLSNELGGKNSVMLELNIDGRSVSYSDFEKLAEQIPEIQNMIPISTNQTTISSYRGTSSVVLKAVGHNFDKHAALKVTKGKFITSEQLNNRLKVAVIDDLTADELFGTTEVLGRKVETTVNGNSFEATIIGVCKRLDLSEASLNQDMGFIYIPITILEGSMMQYDIQKAVFTINNLHSDVAKAQIAHFLEDRGVYVDKESFELVNQLETISNFTTKNLPLLLAMVVLWFLAAILGLINIFLVDVVQSKKYYGLLLFYGNTKQSVRKIVYLKAYNAALVSSIVSLIIALVASIAANRLLNLPFYISIHSLSLGLLLPIVVCMAAAIYPVSRATNIDFIYFGEVN